MSQPNQGESSPRRSRAYVSLLGITMVHLSSPIVVAFWSVAFPGLGHILISKYLRGYTLFIWEVFINTKAHVNLLIFYSFLGDFEKAKQIADIRWLLLYIPIYIFAIWDSYRATIEENHAYILAAREDAEIKPYKIGFLEINISDKRRPWVTAMWSLLAPGTGYLYLNRLVSSFFIIGWWIVICYYSKLLPSIHYTILGDFAMAKSVLNMQWFLNLPSVYLFSVYDSYVSTVEYNKLFDWEQAKFLKKNYQNNNFIMPLKKGVRSDRMYVISTFDHSIYLELAVTAIEMKGIKKENILAISMDRKGEAIKLFDTIHSSDGLSLFDLPALLGVLFGIFGSVYGFVLKWGPLLWGLIGIAMGFVIGFIMKWIVTKKYNNRQKDQKGTEVVLIIECAESQTNMVKDLLWSHNALGVRKLEL